MWGKRKKDLSRWLSSKLFNVAETVIGEIRNENPLRFYRKNSEETGSEACAYSFGYLRTLPKKDPIPDECLICMKVMQCVNRHTT